VLFLRKRAAIVKAENEHTMKLFDLWGVMMFVPTALELAIYLAAVFAADNLPEITFVLLRIVFNAMKNTALYIQELVRNSSTFTNVRKKSFSVTLFVEMTCR
jgi:hypothetical protein